MKKVVLNGCIWHGLGLLLIIYRYPCENFFIKMGDGIPPMGIAMAVANGTFKQGYSFDEPNGLKVIAIVGRRILSSANVLVLRSYLAMDLPLR